MWATFAVAVLCGGSCVNQVQAVQTYSNVYAQEQLRFVAVAADPYYAAVAAQRVRQENERQQARLAQAEADELAKRVEELSASVDRLTSAINTGVTAVPTEPVPQTPETHPVPEPVAPTTTPATHDAATLSPPTQEAWNVIITKCAGCHTQGQEKNNSFAMVTADGKPANMSASSRLRADLKMYEGSMPPAAPLSDEEYNAMRTWMIQDADALAAALKRCQ